MENNNEKIENQQGETAKKTNIFTDIIEIIESTLVTVFIIVLVFTYVLHPVNIVGHSMVPTLNKDYDPSLGNTDKIFMSTVFFDVEYGDILVINKDVNYLLDDNGNPYIPEGAGSNAIGECIIKRVIATGGQTIDIRDGKALVRYSPLKDFDILTDSWKGPENG